MKYFHTLIFLTFFSLISKAQYPFETFSSIKFEKYYQISPTTNFSHIDTKGQYTIKITNFFNNNDSITLQFAHTENVDEDSSYLTLFRNGIKITNFIDNLLFHYIDTVFVADINGDKLKDIKIIIPYNGCGIAAMNVKIIYLFQNPNNKFTYISFDDKIGNERLERDFDNDGNYEIITMDLLQYQSHSYWIFNLFCFINNDLINVNNKFNYPIMIQYLNRDNFEITNKISRLKMKKFQIKMPNGYVRR